MSLSIEERYLYGRAMREAEAAAEDMPSFAKTALDEAVAAKGMRFDQTAIINEALKKIGLVDYEKAWENQVERALRDSVERSVNPPVVSVADAYRAGNNLLAGVIHPWGRELTATEKGNAATLLASAMERARMTYERERHLINTTNGGDQANDQANQLAYMRLKQEMAAIEVSQEERARIRRYNDWAASHQRLPQRAVPEGWWEDGYGQWRPHGAPATAELEDDNEPEKEPEHMSKNFSTLIFLYDDAVRAIKATYLADDDPTIKAKGLTKAPETMFKTYDTTLKVGDIVVVPSDTRHKMATVKVSAVNVQDEIDFDDQKKVDWVVGKVFADEYESNKARDEKAAEAMRHAEKIKRREELKADLEKAGIGAAVSSTYLPASPQPAPVQTEPIRPPMPERARDPYDPLQPKGGGTEF